VGHPLSLGRGLEVLRGSAYIMQGRVSAGRVFGRKGRSGAGLQERGGAKVTSLIFWDRGWGSFAGGKFWGQGLQALRCGSVPAGRPPFLARRKDGLGLVDSVLLGALRREARSLGAFRFSPDAL